MCIHRYICIETMIPTMPFWQLMSRADQLEACKRLKLQKGQSSCLRPFLADQ